jgi:hypothetical protein
MTFERSSGVIIHYITQFVSNNVKQPKAQILRVQTALKIFRFDESKNSFARTLY